MEPHIHPHIHHEKKWKDYLLEFIMIFLAVTMGFIAESLRENISNRAKEKDYIKGFISNLQKDTSQLRNVINFNQMKVRGIDSLLTLKTKGVSTAAGRLFRFKVANLFRFGISN